MPQNWRTGIVISIPKPGKNKFSPEGYRPTTLLNNLGKILEKIVNYRLTLYIEKINYIAKDKSVFANIARQWII